MSTRRTRSTSWQDTTPSLHRNRTNEPISSYQRTHQSLSLLCLRRPNAGRLQNMPTRFPQMMVSLLTRRMQSTSWQKVTSPLHRIIPTNSCHHTNEPTPSYHTNEPIIISRFSSRPSTCGPSGYHANAFVSVDGVSAETQDALTVMA